MSKTATTIYLWGDQPEALRKLSEEEWMPVAALIRDAIDDAIYPDGVPAPVADARRRDEAASRVNHSNTENQKMLARVERAAELAAKGLALSDIATELRVSERTARGYLARAKAGEG